MLRLAEPVDAPELIRIATDTGVFRSIEILALREVLDDYFARNRDLNHQCVAAVSDGVIDGFVYYAPTALTDRTWHLYWVAVEKRRHGRGIGAALLRFVEEDLRGRSGRLLVIETSSLPHYESTRRFYLRHGYEQAAAIRDYYADGDDLVVFAKRLAG